MAPGGKTAELAEQMGNDGLIVAVDVDPIRLEDTRQNLQRLGVRSADSDAAMRVRRSSFQVWPL